MTMTMTLISATIAASICLSIFEFGEAHWTGYPHYHAHRRRSNEDVVDLDVAKFNRNPMERHQNLVEDPFQKSIADFYKRVSDFHTNRPNYYSGFGNDNFDPEYLAPPEMTGVLHAKGSPANPPVWPRKRPDEFSALPADYREAYDRMTEKISALPDNFHDADAAARVTPDGKIVKSRFEVHKNKDDNSKSFSYSTSNSVTW